jgi:alanyl-tRNA synthetase
VFLITSEGSAAAGIRRIEAVTGRGAYALIQRRFRTLKQTSAMLATALDDVPAKTQSLLDELETTRKQIAALRAALAATEFIQHLENVPQVAGVSVLTATLSGADADTLRQMTDRFRDRYSSGVVVLASVIDERPILVAAVTPDLTSRGFHAGELVKYVAAPLGGGGGGRPTLAQAGGKDASRLVEALDLVAGWVERKLAGE